jgi:hypothetical protein
MRNTVVVALLVAVFALGGALLASAAQPQKRSATITQLQKQVGKLARRVRVLERHQYGWYQRGRVTELERRMDQTEIVFCLATYISDYLGRLHAALPAEVRPAKGPPGVRGGAFDSCRA